MELKDKTLARKALKDDELEAVNGGISNLEFELQEKDSTERFKLILEDAKNLIDGKLKNDYKNSADEIRKIIDKEDFPKKIDDISHHL